MISFLARDFSGAVYKLFINDRVSLLAGIIYEAFCGKVRIRVLNTTQEWQRADAEKRIAEVLQGAKNGRLQLIADVDGVFEVRFTAKKRERAGDYLARGGPDVE